MVLTRHGPGKIVFIGYKDGEQRLGVALGCPIGKGHDGRPNEEKGQDTSYATRRLFATKSGCGITIPPGAVKFLKTQLIDEGVKSFQQANLEVMHEVTSMSVKLAEFMQQVREHDAQEIKSTTGIRGRPSTRDGGIHS